MASSIVKATCLVLITAALVAPLAEAAIPCGTVLSSLKPCLPYVQGKVNVVPAACCSRIKSLYVSAKTRADRPSICSCLKSLVGSIKGINFSRVADLPGKCDVNIPYKLSPSTDCSKIP